MNVGRAWRRVELLAARARVRSDWLDHVVAMLSHYSRVYGSGLASAVTYFGFLAFFPLMALAFSFVGVLANVFPDAQQTLEDAINSLFQGLIGDDTGEVPLTVFQDNAGAAGVLGLLGLVYAGLGWMSAMRMALQVIFEKPQQERPNFFIGKARDLTTLVVVGLMLMTALGLTSAVNRYSDEIIELVGLDPDAWFAQTGLVLFGWSLALVLITGTLMVVYQLLGRPHVSHRALREGAILAAIGFVLLKLLGDWLIAFTHGNPAFALFGVALVLLVLMNYFSRAVMLGAAWARTSKREPDLFEHEQAGPHWRKPD